MHSWVVRRVRTRGFTLIEMGVAVGLMLMLAVVGIYTYNAVQASTHEASAKSLLADVAAAENLQFQTRGSYVTFQSGPNGDADLRAMFGEGDPARGMTFVGPKTNSTAANQISVGRATVDAHTQGLALAVRSHNGDCILRVSYPPNSQRDAVEATLPAQTADCSASRAFSESAPDLVDTGQRPDVPADLAAEAGNGSNTITWVTQPDVTYQLTISCLAGADVNVNCDEHTVNAGVAGKYVDSNLAGGVTYAYTLTASRGTLVSQPAGPVTATPRDALASNAIEAALDVTATAFANTSSNPDPTCGPEAACIKVSWINSPGGAAGYRVYRDGSQVSSLITPIDGAYASTFLDTAVEPGHSYRYTIGAADQVITPPSSDVLSLPATATTYPLAATGLTGVRIGQDDTSCPEPYCARLTWSNAAGNTAGISSYRVYRDDKRVATTTDTQAVVTGLSPQTAYEFSVVAVNTAGASPYPAPTVTISAGLGAPTSLAANNDTPGSITLTWAAVPGADQYRIYSLADDTYTDVNAASSTHTIHGLTGLTSYSYRVAARAAGQSGPKSDVVRITTKPAPITGLSTTSTATSVRLTWDDQNYALYDVTRDGVTVASGLPDSVFTDSGLNPATTYSYRVIAKGSGLSTPSNALNVVTLPGKVGAVTAEASGTDITLTWPSAVTSKTLDGQHYTGVISSYRIYSCTTQNCQPDIEGAPAASTGATGWTDTTQGEDATVTYVVVAYNTQTRAGAASATVTAVTAPSTPSNLTADDTTSTITLTWNGSPVADSYEILRCESPCTPSPAADLVGEVSGGDQLEFTDTQAVEGVEYTYAVQAVNSAGTSQPSTTVQAALVPEQPRVTQVPTTPTTATVRWSVDSEAAQFTIEHCQQGGSCSTQELPGDLRSYTIAALDPGATYSVRIQAATGPETSTWSSPKDFTTPIPAPVNLVVTAQAGSTLRATWTALSTTWPELAGYSGLEYEVYVNGQRWATTSGVETTQLLLGTGTSSNPALVPNRDYSVTVGARTPYGRGVEVSVAADGHTNQESLALTATSADPHSLTLQWPVARFVDTYTSRVCALPGCANVVSTWTGGATSHTFTGLDPNTRYHVEAQANYETTVTALGSQQMYTRPVAPSTLTLDGVDARNVTMSWAPVAGATSYRISRDGQELATISSASLTYTDAATQVVTSHTYTVATVAAGGTSPASPSLAVDLNPIAVNDLTAQTHYQGATLTWSAIPGASSYLLYRCQGTSCTPTGPSVAAVNAAAVTTIDEGLGDYTNYRWSVVVSFTHGGTGPASNIAAGRTAPAAAGQVRAASASTTSLDLAWDPVPGATTYELYRGATLISTQPGTTFTDSALTPGTQYVYAVVAGNTDGNAPPGAASTLVTLPQAPTLTTTTTTDTTASINWAASSQVITGYRVWLDGSPALVASGTTYTWTGLTPGSQHTLEVAAFNASGQGPKSARTIRTRASTPLNIVAIPTTSSLDLTWTVPAAGSSFSVTLDGQPHPSCVDITVAHCSIAGLSPARQYEIGVTANTDTPASPDGASATATLTAQTLANAPTSLHVTVTGTTVLLTWAAPTGDITGGYNVFRCDSTDSPCVPNTKVATGAATAATNDVGSQGLGREYSYTVTASTTGGQSAPSAKVVAPIAPDAPASITATWQNAEGSVAVQFTPPTGAAARVTSYLILRCEGTCSPGLSDVVGTVTATGASTYTFSDSSAGPGHQYTYSVAAASPSGYSDPAQAQANILLPPAAPSWTSSIASGTQAALTWSPQLGATSYELVRCIASDCVTIPSPVPSFTDTGLLAGTAYTYKVRAVNSSGSSPDSASTMIVTVPDAVNGLAGVKTSASSVQLTWPTPAGTLTGYSVQYRVTGQSTWTTQAATSSPWTVTALAQAAYEFRVAAVNAAGAGGYSSIASVSLVTVPGAPTAVSASVAVANLVPNPSIATGTTGWVVTGGAMTRSTSDGYAGDSAAQVTHNAASAGALKSQDGYRIPVTAGTTYTFSGYVKQLSGDGSFDMDVFWYDANTGGSQVSSNDGPDTAANADTWTRVSQTRVAPAGATYAIIRLGLANSPATAGVFLADAFQAEAGSAASVYFDGSYPGAAWQGAENLSTSLPGDRVNVRWTAPSSTGGAPISGYVVEYRLSPSGSWTSTSSVGAPATGAGLTGLTGGSAYDFRVSASNSAGTGPTSSAVTFTPVTSPGAPSALAVAALPANLVLSPSVETTNTTNYYSSQGLWSASADVAYAGTRSAKVTMGSAGDTNTFYLKAAGYTASPGVHTVSAYFYIPEGSALAGRQIRIQAEGGSGYTNDTANSEAPTLVPGTWVRAVRQVTFAPGFAAPSLVARINASADPVAGELLYTDAWMMQPTAGVGSYFDGTSPGAAWQGAANSSVSIRTGTVALTWSAPVTNGGSPISDYQVEYRTGAGASWSVFNDGVSSSTSATVTGLTSGTSYDFRVSAINAIGIGPGSPSVSQTAP